MADINSIYEPLGEHLGCDLELVCIEDEVLALQDITCGLILLDIMAGVKFQVRRHEGMDCPQCNRPMIQYCPECEDGANPRVTIEPLLQ
jgi:hypothetical protein